MSIKTVLISAFEFYPLNNGGTFRLVKFAKYLQLHGWTPIVVAPDWNETNCAGFYDKSMVGKDPCVVIRIPYTPPLRTGLKQQAKKWKGRLWKCWAYEFGELPGKMLQTCRAVINEKKIDAVLVSSLPHFVLWIGQELHNEFRIPWIADHRDLVDQETPINYGNLLLKYYYLLQIRKKVFQETQLTKTASAITTVSDPLAEKLRARSRAPVHVIMNGYDPDDFFNVKVKRNKDIFQIAYFGSFFGFSDPGYFLDGLDKICKTKPEIANGMQIWFYGKSSDLINNYTYNRPCADMIKRGGFLPHRSALMRQREVDALYLISHPSRGIVTGKIFEYINAGVPVISVPGDKDITDRILKETGVGVVCRTPEQVYKQLLEWFHEWKAKGRIERNVNQTIIEQYSRKKQVGQLATLLDSILE